MMSSEVYDIDTEQLQARYDPRLLSEDVNGYHSTSNEDATSCGNSNVRYMHGQKVHVHKINNNIKNSECNKIYHK